MRSFCISRARSGDTVSCLSWFKFQESHRFAINKPAQDFLEALLGLPVSMQLL